MNFRVFYIFAIGVVENLLVFALLMAIIYDGLASSRLCATSLRLVFSLRVLKTLSTLTLSILTLSVLCPLAILLALSSRFSTPLLFLLFGSLFDGFLCFLDGTIDATAYQDGDEHEKEKYEKHKT